MTAFTKLHLRGSCSAQRGRFASVDTVAKFIASPMLKCRKCEAAVDAQSAWEPTGETIEQIVARDLGRSPAA